MENKSKCGTATGYVIISLDERPHFKTFFPRALEQATEGIGT